MQVFILYTYTQNRYKYSDIPLRHTNVPCKNTFSTCLHKNQLPELRAPGPWQGESPVLLTSISQKVLLDSYLIKKKLWKWCMFTIWGSRGPAIWLHCMITLTLLGKERGYLKLKSTEFWLQLPFPDYTVVASCKYILKLYSAE